MHLPFKSDGKAGGKKTDFLKVHFTFLSAGNVTLHLKYFSYKHSWVMRLLYAAWQLLYSPAPTPCPFPSTWPFYYTPLPVIITFVSASVTRAQAKTPVRRRRHGSPFSFYDWLYVEPEFSLLFAFSNKSLHSQALTGLYLSRLWAICSIHAVYSRLCSRVSLYSAHMRHTDTASAPDGTTTWFWPSNECEMHLSLSDIRPAPSGMSSLWL